MMASFYSRLANVNKHNLRTLRAQPLNELSGALGDLGTLLPLLIALTLTDSISLSATLVFSGIANIATGAAFGIPLPVQPMKAIAAIAISQSYTKTENISAGLFVGGVVTLLSLSGLLKWFGRVVPIPVVRGIQMGAGLALVISAGGGLLKPLGWISPSWSDNWLWAMAAFVFLLLSSLVSRVPYALLVFLLGLTLGGIQLASSHSPQERSGFHTWHPRTYIPSPSDFYKGAFEAGLPQLPLTTLNSILAVTSLSASLFPSYPPTPSNTEIGLSVGIANLVGCWFGAMPVCHGSGGLAGQYRFGARSGASIIILGLVKLILGLTAGESIIPLLQRFPKSLLGVMVLAAGVELAKVGQSLDDVRDLWEETEQENEDAADKRRKLNEQEKRNRWAVMLVTVAGCLAFKNDAVGFIAGMVWHWGLKASEWVQQRQERGQRRLTRFFTTREYQEGEDAPLLQSRDAVEGRIA
ncbi:hypothetical protein E4T38_01925 [Aureobasidium subglaciale]|nr:hypothetical protein E4T38_01925 [Aureobasidium subglaciale]KAI5229278.1 hypothetical protein E4T40_01555 [Aureobasidium subglaciale]KAI5232924.1 hypothetical protein E4T41_01923 [Aureobasidium subglaciale]KAI5266422.1 hypothetical protein E4T46_01552 [Aureobasidium subglaciale]